MTKAETFECASLSAIKNSINLLAEKHEIIGVSIATFQAGYTTYYTAVVLYALESE